MTFCSYMELDTALGRHTRFVHVQDFFPFSMSISTFRVRFHFLFPAFRYAPYIGSYAALHPVLQCHLYMYFVIVYARR